MIYKINKIRMVCMTIIVISILISTAVADSIPPSSITNLSEKAVTTTSINWTWKNPSDIDFAKVMVYIDGKFKKNVTKIYQYYKASNLLPNTTHIISTHTVDTSGNINSTWINLTSVTKKDTTYPNSISDLKNVTYAPYYIKWVWNDSTSSDFAYVMIYINGVYVTNVLKGVKNYNATNLNPDTIYTIGTRTVDTSGNINKSWINKTSITATSLLTQTVTKLRNVTYEPYYINWTWVDPTDLNYTNISIYIDGVFITNLGRNIRYYNATFVPDTSHEISTQTVDKYGNINPIWVNNTARTLDNIPPQSIDNLNNISYDPTYINWTWNDPPDKDFAKIMVYIDGKFIKNVTKGVEYYNSTFPIGTFHNISTHTVDTNGNVNNTWINNTEKTKSIIRMITIGDTHLSTSTSDDAYKNFTRAINYVNNMTNVDLVVQMGDIVDNGSSISQFNNAKSVISKLKVPYRVVEGNHDIGLATNNQGKNFIAYFGPTEHVENLNGYQLVFVGMDNINSTNTTLYWTFNSNPDKTKPTIIFSHGPVQPKPNGKSCSADWGNYFNYACSMAPYVNTFTNLLGYYAGHVHEGTNQTIGNTLYVTEDNLAGYGDDSIYIGYTVIEDQTVKSYVLIRY